jgi:transcriptional regulator with XRE-family HTH domain/mannose-6-phosphate isomerase-like protein (cupin superfamily)
MSEEAAADDAPADGLPPEPGSLQPSLDLGARLRAQRLSTGLSLREMARRLGRSPSAMSQFETGKARPSVSTLFEIVELLGTSIDSLLGTDDPAAKPAAGRAAPAHLADAGRAAGPSRHPAPAGSPELADPAGLAGSPERVNSTGAAGPAGLADPADPDTDPAAAGASVLDMPNRVILERAADHPCIDLENRVQWTRLSRSMSGVEFLLVTYPPGSWSSGADGRFMHHAGHEFAYLLSGALTVEISFDNHLDTYEVRAGDSITFPAPMPHRLGNRTGQPATAIWCIFAAGSGGVHKNGVWVSPAADLASIMQILPTSHEG